MTWIKCYGTYILCLIVLLTSSCKEKPTESSEIGNTIPGIPTVSYEGKVYNTVQIGDQGWLRENLDVGTSISVDKNQTDNGVIEKYCYDFEDINCDTYGGLYQWDEAIQYSTDEPIQGICPPGWHLPTLEEFNKLVVTSGGSANALKAIGQGTGNGIGTNLSGFSILLAGYRKRDSTFSYIDGGTGFWISTESSENCAWIYEVHSNHDNVISDCYYKDIGFSVRCIKD